MNYEDIFEKFYKDLNSSQAPTGHTIRLSPDLLHNPFCPIHKKRAIISEPPDELGIRRWFCIDCVLNALYKCNIDKRVKK